MFIAITQRMMLHVRHTPRPKNVSMLWLRWVNHNPLAITGKSTGKFRDSGENSTESLIAGELSDGTHIRQDQVEVPKAFLAVYVGPDLRRFVIPASYLSMPDFRGLMERVAEEFGFEQEGGLRIPCEENDFEDILIRCSGMHRMMSKNKKKKSKIEFLMDVINGCDSSYLIHKY